MLLYNVIKVCIVACLISAAQADSRDIIHKTLDNGLNIVIKEDHRYPVANVTFSYRVGSIHEPPYQSGVSHFLERIMFGRTNNLSHSNIEDYYNQHSGHYNAMTTYEYTQYSTSVSPDEISSVLQFEKDRLTDLQFVDADIEKERKVILQEKNQYLTHSPWSEPKEFFHVLSFPTGVYHHPIIGWQADIEALTLDNLKNWYDQWYQPNNLTIIVIGDVTADQVLGNIKLLFGDIPASKNDNKIVLENKSREGDIRIDLKRDVNNPLFVVGFKTPKPDQNSLDTEITLMLLQDLLTNPKQGLISQELITNNHLAVEVDTEIDYLKKIDGYFSFYIIPNKNIHFYSIKNKLLSILSNISEEDITDQRLTEIKKRYYAKYVFHQDSINYQSKLFSKLISLDLPFDRYSKTQETLDKITKKSIISTLKTYFNEDSPKVILTVKPL
ncbi:MAG: pitrilysin family protein [Pseudomonadota bacterium]|nr:pitrilysin family protein [Pseudomonadota bacterium]